MIRYKENYDGVNNVNIIELWHSIDWINGSSLSPQRLLSSLKHSDCVMTAWDDDKLIGLCSSMKDSLNVWISYMVVHSDYQNRNIGTELLNRNLSHYKDCRIYVQTTNASAFYQKAGFIETMVSLKRDDFIATVRKE